MKGTRPLVAAFIALTFLIWIGFDVWLVVNGGPTESMVILDMGMRSTLLPFVVGVLAGHWFVPHEKTWENGWVWLLVIFGGLALWDVTWAMSGLGTTWYRYPGVWLSLGVPSGALLFGQRER